MCVSVNAFNFVFVSVSLPLSFYSHLFLLLLQFIFVGLFILFYASVGELRLNNGVVTNKIHSWNGMKQMRKLKWLYKNIAMKNEFSGSGFKRYFAKKKNKYTHHSTAKIYQNF